METFDEILSSYLRAYQKDPDQDVDKLIDQMADSYGISGEGKSIQKKTNAYLDSFQQKIGEMQKAKASRIGRQTWFANEISNSLDSLTEDRKKKVMDSLLKQFDEINEMTNSKEERHG